MRKYQSTYPLFEDNVDKMLLKAHRELMFVPQTKKTIILLNQIKEDLENHKELLAKHPSISETNLGKCLNDEYLRDPNIHGINVKVLFKKQPDLSRLANVSFEIYRK